MRTRLAALLALGVFLFMSTPASARSEVPLIDLERAAAEANNRLALDLFAELRGESGNLAFSPESISAALGMTEAGARGQTADQMREVLHWNQNSVPSPRAAAPFLMRGLRRDKRCGAELHIANALWGQHGFPIADDFRRHVEDTWGGKLEQLDFRDRDAAARAINAWVEAQTRDRIKELLSPDNVGPDIRLVLTNAIYFKGEWASPFKDKQTRDEPFHAADGETITVSMMHQTEELGYAENDACQVLQVPYKGEGLAMVVLLPRQLGELRELEAKLADDALAAWLKPVVSREVVVSLPRFTVTHRLSLSDTLKAMGMADAFSDKADFSGIATQERLMISEVLHKAFVEVNEKGTEAAAATAIIMAPTAPRRVSRSASRRTTRSCS